MLQVQLNVLTNLLVAHLVCSWFEN